ncbi:hypothetical protein [Actinokineospora inagensis]|uniref:hypothetical protein n=1 Tax=Actinokineospora inagensis TaxID=103730 RepID=UPI0004228A1A|nr:hypothetical protein [Actinokineospora inagensis]
MADQGVMSTPIFDQLLREMTEGAAAAEQARDDAQSVGGTGTPAPKPSQGGRRRAKTS